MCLHMEADECPTGGPYAIIVSGSNVTEKKLEYHGPGTDLENSISGMSNRVRNGLRTVRLSRSLKGISDHHYTFDTANQALAVIMSSGCEMKFAQHCGHGSSEINFLQANKHQQVCQTGIEGTIGGNKFSNQRCAPFPTSDLLDQHNPTCDIRTYRGGLSCCRHGRSLLDKNQEIPWSDTLLEYRLKFRFYFEEYRPASHKNLVFLYWQTEAHAGEYDIVPCPEGTPKSQCIQEISSRWKVSDMMHDCSLHNSKWCTGKGSKDETKVEGIQIMYAGPHCHAPSCLSMELYNADTGRLICSVVPIQGKTHRIYDEHGFLAIPPCLWGDPSEGLLEPELMSLSTTLLSIKRNNNTFAHTGDMASWQMRGVVVPKAGIATHSSKSSPNRVQSDSREDIADE